MRNTRRYLYLFIGIVGAISATAGMTVVATAALIFLVSINYHNLKANYDALGSLGIICALVVIVSSTIYLIGQHIFPLPGELIRFLSFFFLSISCVVFTRTEIVNKTKRSLFMVLLVSMAQIAIGVVSSARLVSFLGFGYDNYAHLYAFRRILEFKNAFMGITNPDQFVTYLFTTPLGTHMSMALVGETIGLNSMDDRKTLAFFTLITVLMPFGLIAVCLRTISGRDFSLPRKVLANCLIFSVLMFGYPSHIFFSGYLTSNFATLIMAIGFGVLTSKASLAHKMNILIILGIAEFLVYPVYSIFLMCSFIAVLILGRFELLKVSIQRVCSQWLRYLCVSAVMGTLVYFAYFALTSGNGVSKFLEPGGIEPLPIGATMFIFGIVLGVLFKNIDRNSSNSMSSIALVGCIIVAISGLLIAYYKTRVPGQFWYLPYYPTKLTISVLVLSFIFLVDRLIFAGDSDSKSTMRSAGEILVVLISAVVLIAPTYKPWPFSQGYMGNTEGVIRSLVAKNSEVVEGNTVLIARDFIREQKLSGLYLSDVHESELNTRWINSLNLYWTDVNWAEWFKSRALIDEGRLDEAATILNGKFVLIIDNFAKFNNDPIAFDVFKNVCVINKTRGSFCRRD